MKTGSFVWWEISHEPDVQRATIYWVRYCTLQLVKVHNNLGSLNVSPLFCKGRNRGSEDISYLFMIAQLVSGGARIQTHICYKTLFLKQPATNCLHGSCPQCSTNATSSFHSCLLACFMLFHASLPRLLCTSVLLP